MRDLETLGRVLGVVAVRVHLVFAHESEASEVHTSLSMRTDSYGNYWIIAQETRQKSAIGHVTAF